ncbi:c-di-GMP-binding flagellar brake protein YcgR [Nocardioides sp. BE266]|uniref:flagellar brake protein n=1 Tax=Nocardioides sp. BE266 TaxID=2817725 RepID=UPI00285AE05D|nr:PilZ domain-containing protein [Nocardioides sp. BE266]MDR7255194.1 c-di-GMP-binding flagellar brake protein YcgR [Nocardioides sp. BE266]
MGVPGVDVPEVKDVVDVFAADRGTPLVSFVEATTDDEVVLAVARTREGTRVPLPVGERLEIVWRGRDELRSVPVEIVAVERGETPLWRVRPVGPATKGQRRRAVRAQMGRTVQVVAEDIQMDGVTLDVSEGGMKVVLGHDVVTPPRAGGIVAVQLQLDGGEVACNAEVVQHFHRHDGRHAVSFRFIDLPSRTEDLIRREVFEELRVQRARGLA